MTMTCVFPRETPCGLNIIGRTPARLWDPSRGEGCQIMPGDRVIFEPIPLATFEALTKPAAEGGLQPRFESAEGGLFT